jgi:hypothetical protein
MKRLHYFIFLLSFHAFSNQQSIADILLLSHPESYTILNQYQQLVTATEKKMFVANAPLQIEAENEVLGDQITPALKFSFEGKIWFLQKDEKGILLGDKGKQNRQVLKKCAIIGDTVQITADKSIPFAEKGPFSVEAGFLKKGEQIIRLFSYNGVCCVKRPGAKSQYGWSRFGQNAGWKRQKQVVEKQEDLTDELTRRILLRFESANKTYKEYFTNFAELTRQEKTAPVWKCEVRKNEVRCTLNKPYTTTSLLDESTKYLLRDIENMLIGKHFDVAVENGSITVSPKNDGGNMR